MRLAITDLGSNTIRTVLYENGAPVLNTSVFAGVVQYIENEKLSQKGVSAILQAFSTLSPHYTSAEMHIAFATASLRGLQNSTAIINEIREKTGVFVRLLSAEEEARYDYLGLMRAKSVKEGIGGDLGGGSMQLYTFSERGLGSYCSLPLGSMRLRCAFSEGDMPSPSESVAIKAHVLAQLKTNSAFLNAGYETLYLTGGSIRAIVKLFGKGGRITKDEIHAAIRNVSYERLKTEVGNRAQTIVPALLTLEVLLSYTGVMQIEAVESGVREGILAELSAKA